MAAPGVFDLHIYKGDSVVYTLTLSSRVNGTSVPIDLTGMTGTAQIRRAPHSSTVMASFDVRITDPANGVVELELDASASNALQQGVWDFQTVDASGRVRTWLAGKVYVTSQVTR